MLPGSLLEIDFWNVGQGDCSVIKLPSGGLIIVDVGPRGSPLVEWLREGRRRSVRIEAIVLTHNDADHAGSLPTIISEFKAQIGAVWLLLDRPSNDERFAKIFRSALQGEEEGHYKIRRVEDGAELWRHAESETVIRVLYPGFSQNVQAAKPNDTSGLIVLESGGRNLLAWPGDLQLRTTAKVVSQNSPQMLMGPHHGGPTDYPTMSVKRGMTLEQRQKRMSQMREAATSLRPVRSFISVGTKNSYNHPRPGYLRLLRDQGTHIACSQLTVMCDRQRVLRKEIVFEGSGALGLRAPKFGVSCRGAVRVYLKDGELHPDAFEAEHRKRLQGLHRPQCCR